MADVTALGFGYHPDDLDGGGLDEIPLDIIEDDEFEGFEFEDEDGVLFEEDSLEFEDDYETGAEADPE